MSKEDEEFNLIERARRGDFGAFEALYEMHKAPIYRTALAITGDRALAEEILQEAFIKAYRHIDKMHEGVSLAPWLYRVTVNLAYDLSAQKRRGMNLLGQFMDWLATRSLNSPEQKLEEREFQDLVYRIINRLEFKQRTTLVLFYMQAFSLQEIAEIMDCPVGTVKSRLHYARRNLKRELLAETRVSGGATYELT